MPRPFLVIISLLLLLLLVTAGPVKRKLKLSTPSKPSTSAEQKCENTPPGYMAATVTSGLRQRSPVIRRSPAFPPRASSRLQSRFFNATPDPPPRRITRRQNPSLASMGSQIQHRRRIQRRHEELTRIVEEIESRSSPPPHLVSPLYAASSERGTRTTSDAPTVYDPRRVRVLPFSSYRLPDTASTMAGTVVYRSDTTQAEFNLRQDGMQTYNAGPTCPLRRPTPAPRISLIQQQPPPVLPRNLFPPLSSGDGPSSASTPEQIETTRDSPRQLGPQTEEETRRAEEAREKERKQLRAKEKERKRKRAEEEQRRRDEEQAAERRSSAPNQASGAASAVGGNTVAVSTIGGAGDSTTTGSSVPSRVVPSNEDLNPFDGNAATGGFTAPSSTVAGGVNGASTMGSQHASTSTSNSVRSVVLTVSTQPSAISSASVVSSHIDTMELGSSGEAEADQENMLLRQIQESSDTVFLRLIRGITLVPTIHTLSRFGRLMRERFMNEIGGGHAPPISISSGEIQSVFIVSERLTMSEASQWERDLPADVEHFVLAVDNSNRLYLNVRMIDVHAAHTRIATGFRLTTRRLQFRFPEAARSLGVISPTNNPFSTMSFVIQFRDTSTQGLLDSVLRLLQSTGRYFDELRLQVRVIFDDIGRLIRAALLMHGQRVDGCQIQVMRPQ